MRSTSNHYSVVGLEWASPGVSGSIVFPLSVSVGFALEFLFSDILIGVSLSFLLLNGGSGNSGNKSKDGSEFHCDCKINYNLLTRVEKKLNFDVLIPLIIICFK